MTPGNINTPEYWNGVYRREWDSGEARSDRYARDYGLVHDAILGLIPDCGRVLDVACGPGILCRKIKRRHPASHVTGVDFSPYVIACNQSLDAPLGIVYRCLDIRAGMKDIGEPFDVVAMCEILEHLDDPVSAVSAALSLLKTGGRFILTSPHDDGIPDPEHVRAWGHDELFHLLSPYSDTVSFMHFPPPYFHVWVLAYLSKGGRGESAP